ncbi:hypothetical protein L484_003881 [Morus notabilis]|uniref:Uncharacterized protein n=1 Tax=Morus notabilis TaxID=981085 RepID=W9RDC8_9ROSA|nr:hypothetical protein L484_003881 [Morus notabilis]
MAKLAVTFVLLCLFFAFSHARFASDLPQIEAFAKEATEILPEADSKPSTTGDILLPSEKHVSEPGSETIQVNLEESVSEPGADDAAPLTLISFRPVNRHFPRLCLPQKTCKNIFENNFKYTPNFQNPYFVISLHCSITNLHFHNNILCHRFDIAIKKY